MATRTDTPAVVPRRRWPVSPAHNSVVTSLRNGVVAFPLPQAAPQGRRSSPATAQNAPALRLSAAERARIEAAISALIDLLDAAAPDADAEPDFDAEAEAEEATLQPVTLAPMWARPVTLGRAAVHAFRAPGAPMPSKPPTFPARPPANTPPTSRRPSQGGRA